MKKLLVLLMSVVTLVAFTGCAQKEVVKNVPVRDIITSIESEVETVKGLSELDFNKEELSEFDMMTIEAFGFNLEDIEEGIIKYPMINLQAEEVIIIKAKDETKMTAIKEALQLHVENQMAAFENYVPENYEMVKNHVLKTEGNYVLLAISTDAAKIDEIFTNALK